MMTEFNDTIERMDTMNFYKKMSLVLAAVLLLGVLAGCGLVKVNEQKDREQVVAEANGVKIKKWEFTALYNLQKAMYQITDEVEKDPEMKEALDSLKASLLDNLAQQALLISKAKDAGFTANSEIRDDVKADLENELEAQAKWLKDRDEANDIDTEGKDYAKLAREDFESQLEIMGINEDEYIDMMVSSKLIEKLYEETVKNVVVTDNDIKKYYDDELENQKEAGQPGDVALYEPEARRVKHILIKLPDEEINEYFNLIYGGSAEDAQKYLDEKLPAIKPKADEVLQKARDGENFEDLINEYNEDTGVETDMYKENDGYMVTKGGGFAAEFEEAAFELEEGQISDLVVTGYGYHIVKLYEIVPEREYSLEEKKDEIEEVVEMQKKAERFQEKVKEWTEAANIKTYKNRV